jgi:ParB family transcriptional regulator, chromosome partitioning protein
MFIHPQWLPLLSMPDDILEALRHGKLHYTKARLLASIKAEGQRSKLLKRAVEDELSLSELKSEVAKLKPKPKGREDITTRVKKYLSPQHFNKLPSKKHQEAQALLEKIEKLMAG